MHGSVLPADAFCAAESALSQLRACALTPADSCTFNCLQGSVLASDAFFPFSWNDSVEIACQVGGVGMS